MKYNFELVHISGKKNGCANTLSRRPDYDQGDQDNKNLTVLPAPYWEERPLKQSTKLARELYTRIMISKIMKEGEGGADPLIKDRKKATKAEKEERTPSAKKANKSSIRLMGSEDVDPSNGPEWCQYQQNIDPWKYQLVQDQVEKDQQENQESQAQLRKWANTFLLQKICLIWWNDNHMVVAGDNNLKRGVICL